VPAAANLNTAVIPAPIAYTNVVAVKKLVVEDSFGERVGGRGKTWNLMKRLQKKNE
jgi:hypothetical protein